MPERTPRDFEGNRQSRDFYTGDLVFHNGAWVSKRDRKKSINEKKEAKRYITNIRTTEAARATTTTAPRPPAPPTTVPIITGAPTTPTTPVGQPMSTAVPPLPSWWINQAIQNPSDPNSQFANVANALLPTLAPEDQRTLATYLATNFKDTYGGYANVKFPLAPTQMTDAIRKQYLSPQRAQNALTLLDKMKTASGVQDMGAGYDFLTNAVRLINQFTNASGAMPRENYNQFTNAVSSLVGQAGQDISAYANLAQLFNLPKFTAGPLVSNTPNNKLFT